MLRKHESTIGVHKLPKSPSRVAALMEAVGLNLRKKTTGMSWIIDEWFHL